jgi:hypothetical protein
MGSARGRVSRAGSYPTIRAGIVSPASVHRGNVVVNATPSTPDDHFTAGPNCSVIGSARGRVGRAGGCPRIRAGMVCPASVQHVADPKATPNNHFSAGPDCCVLLSGRGRVGGAGGCPTIRAGIISPAGIPILARPPPRISAPNDHLTAGPDCRMILSNLGRVGRAGSCPTIRAGIVSAAGVEPRGTRSAPNNHFPAGPYCGVIRSALGRVGGAGSCPTIHARIVSTAGDAVAAPDNHFTAGPDCRVKGSCTSGINGARSPPLVCARVGNFRQSVDNLS